MASMDGDSLTFGAMASTEFEVDLTALVESYAGLLFRVAHSILRSRTDAEDVVQDAFVRVLEHRGRLPEVREMRVWLVRIAWNLAIDRRRRIKPQQMDEVFAQGLASRCAGADRVLAETQRMQEVLAEIERLPAAERYVLLLAGIEELGTAEIATVVGKSESAVRALLFRARTRLRERLQRAERKGGRG